MNYKTPALNRFHEQALAQLEDSLPHPKMTLTGLAQAVFEDQNQDQDQENFILETIQ